ncbi:helix-turn-helix transcriptional regulator [Frondihabitans australicus]|uniref:Putative DNA-binding transcriptional regulator YafY n=1 Tax=Frondihabitans australicus TaxID=386892 RepID=A0A495IKI7_9MICO|nr:WYL domain-containing protein [Frondihabitans australicus]RKR76463.1 putative DNA-binding transcriptional regulator YafY [Frondihabitans australicus]
MAGPSSRMLELLSLLQVRRDWGGDVLASRLDVSPRTVRRDVERLRDLGYRIDSLRGPAGGYRLASGSELPPLLFDDDQAVAVALALAVAPASGADIGEAAARALATIRQVMPQRLRHRVDAVEVQTSGRQGVADPATLVAVSEATRAHEVLRFDYASPEGTEGAQERPPRRVEPHAVVARSGRWYLVAWDLDASDWRTFRIDRMTPRTPTRRAFAPREIPGGDALAFVAARFRGSSTSAWPCVGTCVVDRAVRDVAPYLDDDATVEALGPDRSRVTMGSWSWGALAARFAGFDAAFEVVGPAELRDAVGAVAGRLAAAAGDSRRATSR